MKSISTKLTLAFLSVTLLVVGLAAFFTWRTTVRAFETVVVERIRTEFIKQVTTYYEENGSWQGVIPRLFPMPEPVQNKKDQQARPLVFALTDLDGQVLVPAGQYRPRDIVDASVLADGTPVKVNDVIVGYAVQTGKVPELSAVEQGYIDRTNRALFLTSVAAMFFALLLGGGLANSLTRPIRDLTEATHAMADGDLEQKVPVRSVDELGELTASFNQMASDLARATQSRRQMTADIAHDLGTPLTVIGGYLEAIQEGVLDATPERIDVMHTQIVHLQRLVQDLRTLSLADAGQMSLNRQPVDVGALLRRVAASYQLAAEQQGIELSVETGQTQPSTKIDEDRMAQVLGNLVSNALRYTTEGGEIKLAASLTVDHSLLITVADTGKGIEPQDLGRIFERFYRADHARDLKRGESGLGLAIARSIVETHGGTISVESEVGRGTKFAIRLPA